ncbi:MULTISPECIES: ABC transporter substrate-binding protein [Arthrobacter]|uniref:Peptide/nickel transport system substrate-binding protein n=1 Tax=Arthrobacter bambusae TaxID=1338426 RepID=A0AAW8DI26_9MICC|nr:MULTISPECIES: ABC transporter substrate-binding protein [Arthrobacter]MDP9904844.1 peptide/nickel transport system substrate-binding protein [Arthrobacter bambusae]MDQ0129660.1 peptide/nickel transport system substrate-binding protein [Arthrobacter bambusae]MDQ0180727.1 peptide/nickel transport system substrate-binding protein [Arthrobacter bambusae]MDQ0238872.1 peptide/nickel transport system substrate-binding protein [Arthrobacter bambusae]GAP58961.1 glutathione-binding protein GsiB [Arth
MFRSKRMAAVIAAVALGLTACGGGGAAAPQDQSSQTLTLGALLAPKTFAANQSEFANLSPFYQAVYDTLIRMKPDGSLVPMLAKDWKYNADKTVLTLTLRDDVKFTDGTPFNADAAKQNLERFKAGTSPDAQFMAALKTAKAVDATTLELTLSAPDPAFLNYLSKDASFMQSPASFGNADIATKPVGSGPYVLDTAATVTGTSYSYHRNPNYWDKSLVHYDNLVLNVYGDQTSLLNAIKSGQLNAANTADNNTLTEIQAAGYKVNPLQLNWAGLILFDRAGTTNPALKDVRVRQALNYAFDTKAMLQSIGQGYGELTTQVFPPSSAAYDKSLDSRYAYNPAKAKELLAQAGYASGLTLKLPSSALMGNTLPALITQQLKDVGITAEFTDTGNNFIADLLAPKYGVSYMILEQQSDWQLINMKIAPGAPWNPYKYEDPKVDELINKIHVGSTDEQTAAAKELNKYIVEQAWFAPWYRPQSSFVTDAKTKVEVQTGNAYPFIWSFSPAS